MRIWCPVIGIRACFALIIDTASDTSTSKSLLITHSILSILLCLDEIINALVSWWACFWTARHVVPNRVMIASLCTTRTIITGIVEIILHLYKIICFHTSLGRIRDDFVQETEVSLLKFVVRGNIKKFVNSNFVNASWLLSRFEPSSNSTRFSKLELIFSKRSCCNMLGHFAFKDQLTEFSHPASKWDCSWIKLC